MSIEKPHRFEARCEDVSKRLTERLAELPELYAWAYGASQERVVRESAGKITSGAHGDPTLSVVGELIRTEESNVGLQTSIRRTLERAPRQLADLVNSVEAIETAISKAMDRLDPKEKLGDSPLSMTRPPTRAQLTEAREAQQRRRLRGEHIP